MRILGFIPSLLIVPLSFYMLKSLKYKTAGYFASIILSISPFLIFYSTELRFYGLSTLFALLSSYFAVKFIEDKKYFPYLVVSNLLLLYTFNISFVFVFFEFITIIPALKKDKKRCVETLKIFFITGILYLPAFIMALGGIFAYKNSICSFARDIFVFKPAFFSIFLQSYFTGGFFYPYHNNYGLNEAVIKNLFNFKGFYLTLFPVIFCIFAFLKGFLYSLKNDRRLIIFILPSILFLVFEFILATIGKMSLISRYTLISYPLVIMLLSVGVSVFKNKKLITVLFLIFISSFLFFDFSKDKNPLKKMTTLSSPVKEEFKGLNIKEGDYVLVPMIGKLYKSFIPSSLNYIDFEAVDMVLNDVRKYYNFVFDSDTINGLNQKNAREKLKPYIIAQNNDKAPFYNKNIEKFLNEYLIKMEKGDNFIVVINGANTIAQFQKLYQMPLESREKVYYKNSLYYLLISKITFDILNTLENNLKLTDYRMINDSKKSDNNTAIFVFTRI